MEFNPFAPFILILCAALLFLALGASAVRIVPNEQTLIIFRLGSYAGTRGAGTTFLIPFVERGVAVSLNSQTRIIHSVELLLHKRERMRVDVDYTFRVVDPVASVMNVAQPTEALHQLVLTTLQTLAANQTRADFWMNRVNLENEILLRTLGAIANWGMELMHVSLREV